MPTINHTTSPPSPGQAFRASLPTMTWPFVSAPGPQGRTMPRKSAHFRSLVGRTHLPRPDQPDSDTAPQKTPIPCLQVVLFGMGMFVRGDAEANHVSFSRSLSTSQCCTCCQFLQGSRCASSLRRPKYQGCIDARRAARVGRRCTRRRKSLTRLHLQASSYLGSSSSGHSHSGGGLWAHLHAHHKSHNSQLSSVRGPAR